VKSANSRIVTVGEAIDDLLCVEKRRLVDGGTYRGTLRRAGAYAARLRDLPDDPKRKANLAQGLTGFARTSHSDATLRRFRRVEPGGVDAISRFVRLDRNDVAPTLRAGTGLDAGRFMAPRPIHHEFHRVICTREAARLHSFPDWFAFHETKWHSFMQIGNSVPPLLARAVALEVMRALR
jgi:DNA (cytosine-5)-methyltransferase 1